MSMTTGELNRDPARCDAYHEAGHTVVGVVLGLKLQSVSIRDTGTNPPQTVWDHSFLEDLRQNDKKAFATYTENYAIVCLASEYAEELCCDVSSREQKEAFHGDYLDAQWLRKAGQLPYFSFAIIDQLKQRAKEHVYMNRRAIDLVSERLLRGETLDSVQATELMAQAGNPEQPSQ